MARLVFQMSCRKWHLLPLSRSYSLSMVLTQLNSRKPRCNFRGGLREFHNSHKLVKETCYNFRWEIYSIFWKIVLLPEHNRTNQILAYAANRLLSLLFNRCLALRGRPIWIRILHIAVVLSETPLSCCTRSQNSFNEACGFCSTKLLIKEGSSCSRKGKGF